MIQRLKRLLYKLLQLMPAIYLTLLFKPDLIFNTLFKYFLPAQRQASNEFCQRLTEFKCTQGKVLFGFRVNRK